MKAEPIRLTEEQYRVCLNIASAYISRTRLLISELSEAMRPHIPEQPQANVDGMAQLAICTHALSSAMLTLGPVLTIAGLEATVNSMLDAIQGEEHNETAN